LDLYGALEAMPKHRDVEHNAMDRDIDGSLDSGAGVSKKELGRLKSRKALLDKISSVGDVEGMGDDYLEEHDAKRARNNSGNGNSKADVVT
jgi:hypothetical protein